MKVRLNADYVFNILDWHLILINAILINAND